MSGAPVPTIDELLALPAGETYKADARSTVWRVDAPVGSYVLKRYEYAALRQRLGLWLGLHPGQRERRGLRRLRRAGIPAVPVERWAVRRGKYVQATAHGGACLQDLLPEMQASAENANDRREAISAEVAEVAAVAAKLLAAGLVHRDLKLGNVLVHAEDGEGGDKNGGRVVLIDVGAVRRSRSKRRRRATLGMLFHTLGKASRSPADADRDTGALARSLVAAGVERSLLPRAAQESVDSGHE